MATPQEIVSALKAALRRRGVTYARVAEALGLAESSVKRLFARGDFSLARLQQVCELVDLEIGDLVEAVDARRRETDRLSEAQERALVADTRLLLMAFLLLNHWSVERIVAEFTIERLEAVRLLARLDRLGIIDLLPGNRVRMRLSPGFTWRANGPIERVFEEHVQSEFFHSHFDRPGELRLVLNGMLSERSLGVLHDRLHRVAAEFEQLVREDRKLSPTQRLGTTAVCAVRPWRVGLFERYRRRGEAGADRGD